MLPLVCALWALPFSHVHGTFQGSVRIPLLPVQHVQVSRGRFDAHTARIVLRGHVNLEENVHVSRNDAANRWDFEFGEKMQRVLKKYSCRIDGIKLDDARASIFVRFPLVGRYTIILLRETVHSSE
jgi:fructose 1,6-bisphosphatase